MKKPTSAKSFMFINAAREAAKDRPFDVPIPFRCPWCKGNARVVKSSLNGHHHAVCHGCGMKVFE